MHVVSICPRKPEETYRQEDRSNNRTRETSLGRYKTIGCIGDARVSYVVPHSIANGKDHAHEDTKEGEAGKTGRPSFVHLEDDWKSCKHHVKGAIDDSHVYRHQHHDRLTEEQLPRPGKRQRQSFKHCYAVFANL